MQHSVNKLRVVLTGVLIFSTFFSYLYYLYNMQVIDGQVYQQKATDVSSRSYVIKAPRGEIYDINYDVPFVSNKESFSLSLIPAELPNDRMDEVMDKLGEILGENGQSLKNRIHPSRYNSFNKIELMKAVTYEDIVYIAEHIDELPGVYWDSNPIRYYNFSGSISHILGYVGDITQKEIQVLYNQGYKTGDELGKRGIEKQYDMILRGEEGRTYKTVDVKGRKIDRKNIQNDQPPVPGRNLRLTIDRNIQFLAEKALGERKGSVVVLEPSTGEIRAMVSYPWYDPSEFTKPGVNAFGKLIMDEDFPLLNRAVQSSYPPASSFKIIMSAAVLEEEAYPEEQTVLCNGRVYYGDRFFSCWKKTGHGLVDLEDALEGSCNVYYYNVGRDYLGIQKIASYAREFGLGMNTGIDLPGEVAGQVPTPELHKNKYDSNWTKGDTMNVSIGQGTLLTTPLQIADSIAFVLNDGVIYRPHVLKEIINPVTNNVEEVKEREVLTKSSNIAPEHFEKVKSYMRGVVTEGTAMYTITTKATDVAAKTGTAEVGLKENFHSWFAAFAPYDAPVEEQLVVVVMVEASNDWDWWAPRASNIIFQGIFADQTYDEALDSLGWGYLRKKNE